MLKISSYYSPQSESEPFWDSMQKVEQLLPITMAEISQSTVNLVAITEEKFIVLNDLYDISYCKMFLNPDKRPANYIYTVLIQYTSREGRVRTWIQKTRPNLIFCFQDVPKDLISYGNVLKCKIEKLPNLETEDSRTKVAREILDHYSSLKF